ncbi:hypothetical protein Egran_00149 [Elaphomyces granulatus]|uniref:Cation/H+ exchanger transmembrane domain-containing protein n=1 Tax=Elaphomyces granulatus TaxID=519963 RepID=A0A232M6S0_9EURO|nr:hypothetical protein Egran_00149 [Elaphomyces granulatus]
MVQLSALPYHEPDIVIILILTSFLLLLNIIGHVLDKLIYCGLLGQLFIGVAWGSPGGQWLSVGTQEVFVQLGYLGLILLVYEGGLATNFQALKSNLFLSMFVALTGISAPLGISFILVGLVDATPLQAFTAGAALCSTSLGTTFTVLKTSGLTQSRLGVVLPSSAMLDDVVGLVMVQVIANLRITESTFSASTVVRPIGVSIAFAIVVPVVCRFVVKPLVTKLRRSDAKPNRFLIIKSQVAFSIHTAILIGFVVGSSYAGTSNLFAAYLAGACISWYDSEIVNLPRPSISKDLTTTGGSKSAQVKAGDSGHQRNTRVHLDADIDEIVPSTTSPPEPRMPPSPAASENGGPLESEAQTHLNDKEGAHAKPTEASSAALETQSEPSEPTTGMSTWAIYCETPLSVILKPLFFASIGFSIPISQMFTGSIVWRGFVYSMLMVLAKLLCGAWLIRLSSNAAPASGLDAQKKGRGLPRPKSLYPASILGWAMVARGEIGFFISAIAESHGIFSSAGGDGSSELFLIVTWALMLCTIAGPIAVGLLTRRVRMLQKIERDTLGGREDPLGIWGIK